MKKKILIWILKILGVFAILFFGGIFLFLVYFILSMRMTPLYVRAILPFVEIALLLALSLTVLMPRRKWLISVWSVFGCVLLCCAVYVGWGVYDENIPTMDDRSLMLSDYHPFAPGTKAVYLDEPADFRLEDITDEDLRLDGATALYPVYAGFVQAVFPKTGYPMYSQHSEDGYGTVTCSSTAEAYERLINGDTDIIFAVAPSEEQLAAAEAMGMELHFTPIGKEAFVFFVNSKNPVEGLTVEQVQKIYTGEITNWKELGGKNQSIRPFQREENSGSQSALELLMQGLPLIEPEMGERIEGMGSIIRHVANYKNYENAIGFSFRFYASEMDSSNEIRLLSLDGAAPTKENIADGTYPISNEIYAVTAAPIGEPSPRENDPVIKAFIDWVLGPQGQKIVEETGYTAIAPETED